MWGCWSGGHSPTPTEGGKSIKVFITGATGFIGRHLVPILIQRSSSVTCLVRDPSKAEGLAAMGTTLERGDVTDRNSMRAAMQDSDVVFHLAGLYAIGNPNHARMRAINVDGARHTLELAAELGVPKIIHTSTVGVFGNTHGKIVDESYRSKKAALASEYERTKWTAHYEVAIPLQQKGVPVIIVQPGVVTGAGDASHHMAIFDFFVRRMPVMFGAKSGVTVAHVEDVAEGFALAAEKGRPGESYILCGPALTYRQIFEMCEQISGIAATEIWAPGWMATWFSKVVGAFEFLGIRMPLSAEDLRALADYTFWATAEKAKSELGWTPRPVEGVLGEVLEFVMRKSAR